MARVKELCNLETCHRVKKIKEQFYRTLPERMAIPLVMEKFQNYRQGLQDRIPCAEYNCGPLIELRSRLVELENQRGFEYGGSIDRQINMMGDE